MAGTPIVYVICDQNCKFEGMTKEQILTAITQAVNEGTIGNIDTGFITTIKTINGLPLKFFVGEQAEYNALSAEAKDGLFAIITNDTTKDGLFKALETIQTDIKELKVGLLAGTCIVGKAQKLVKEEKEMQVGDNFIVGYPAPFEMGKSYILSVTFGDPSEETKSKTCFLYLPKENETFINLIEYYSTPILELNKEGGTGMTDIKYNHYIISVSDKGKYMIIHSFNGHTNAWGNYQGPFYIRYQELTETMEEAE